MRIAPASAYRPGANVAQRVDAAADPVLRLEHDRLVALPAQLIRGDEAGHAGADDDDPLALARSTLQPLFGDRHEVFRHRRNSVR